MDEMARLVIRVDAKDAREADSALKGLTRTTKGAETGMAGLGAAARFAGPLIGGLVSAAALRRVVELGDAYQQVANRVKLFSTSSQNAEAVQRSLVALSASTRTSLEDTARIYSRISAASADLGVSQADVLRLTKGIAQTFTLSGASAAEAASSGQQLAQALGSGTLAGDELKSIMENNLVLAQAIAKGFGVSVGQLKEMGAQGKLTSEGVFKALLSQTDEIAKKAGTIGPALDAGITTFNTGLLASVGRLDTMLGISAGIARALTSVGEFLADPESFRGTKNLLDLVTAAGQLSRGNFAGAATTAGLNGVRPLTLEQTQARDAARTNPAFRAGGLAPGAAGFGLGFGGTQQTLSGPQSRQFFEFGNGPAAAAAGELRKVTEDLTRAQRDAAAAIRDAREKALQLAADEADGIAAFNEQRAERLSGKLRRAQDALFGLGGTDSVPEPTKRAVQAAKTAASQIDTVMQSLANGLQNTFASGIEGLFTRGTKSVKDFAENLRNTLLRAFSEVLAAEVTGRLLRTLSTLGRSGGAGGGGTAGSVASGLGGIGTAGAKAGAGGLLGLGLAAIAAPIAAGNALGASGRGNAAGATVLGLAFRNPLGALTGFLFGRNRRQRQQEDAAKQLAADAASFADDLIIRTLEASGDSFGATKKRLELSQDAERKATAARFGVNSPQYRALLDTQARERAAVTNESGELSSGVYQAPSGFDVNAYRFAAGGSGRQQTAPPPITVTGPVSFVLPNGTTDDMARDVVRRLQTIASTQGVSRWSEVYPQ
jgi:tape measure domain-containing protein